jgi:hypothetical protein
MDGQTDIRTEIKSYKHKKDKTAKQVDRLTDRQTDEHTNTDKYTWTLCSQISLQQHTETFFTSFLFNFKVIGYQKLSRSALMSLL